MICLVISYRTSQVNNYQEHYSYFLGLVSSVTVGVNKEWKPKTTNPSAAQASGKALASEPSNASFEVGAQSQSVGSKVLDSDDATSNLQKQLEQLHLPQRQHVIIPNHIHVPESERTKLSFGSFDANFGVTSAYDSGPESDNSSTPVSKTSLVVEETEEEPVTRFVILYFVFGWEW